MRQEEDERSHQNCHVSDHVKKKYILFFILFFSHSLIHDDSGDNVCIYIS